MCFTSSKWKSTRVVLWLLLTCYLQPGFGQQLQQSNRYEHPLSRDERFFEIIPAQDHGVYLYRRLASHPNDQLELIKLDTVFHDDWKVYLPIDRRLLLM